uniref:uncharacterized protein LOC131119987 n=1 Tax=Doryrhamphus excisus TaxID=161450 RepID=UPI0025ADA2F6|nr:uncharacterized protein LOC131119987 [Doryrhamphus excisus]
MPTLDAADSPGKLEQMLNKAYEKIAHLLEDIERMSNELQRKDSVLISLKTRFPTLTNWLETSRFGEFAPPNTTSVLGQTVLWDPSSPCRRPACSTPNKGTPWTEVVVRGRKRAPSGTHGGAASPPLPLSNKYTALSVSEKPATRDPHQESTSVAVATGTMPPLTDTTTFPPLTASSPPVGGCPTGSRLPAQEPTRSATRRKQLVRDAVRHHSSHSSRSSHLARYHTRGPGLGGGVAELACSPEDRAAAPTTLVIGDSIVRHVRMREALTLSFPGATVSDVTGKIPDILNSHPQAKRIIIHAVQSDCFYFWPHPHLRQRDRQIQPSAESQHLALLCLQLPPRRLHQQL